VDPVQFVQVYAAARRGDATARELIARRFLPAVERFVQREAGQDVLRLEQPQDLAQRTFEVFLRRLDRLPDYATEEELERALLTLAGWEIRRVLERPRRVLRDASAGCPEAANPSRSRGTVTRADDLRHLGEILALMQPDYADVLRARILEQRSAESTARELGLTVATVKKRLTRARDELLRLTEGWARADGLGERGGGP
jgi:RNA polymerase sigma factor (sigma-70 family)